MSEAEPTPNGAEGPPLELGAPEPAAGSPAAESSVYGQLREQAYIQCFDDLRQRLQTNPTPTPAELDMGTYIEGLEPEVRQAVMGMWQKGYATASSGFAGNQHEMQRVEGGFRIDNQIKQRLTGIGVGVDEILPTWTAIFFKPDGPDIAAISRHWEEVVDLLPARNRTNQAPPTNPLAQEFQQMYRDGSLKTDYLGFWLHKTGNYTLHPQLREHSDQQESLNG